MGSFYNLVSQLYRRIGTWQITKGTE